MRRQSKRTLYESIMRDVARVVKRRLNESETMSIADELMAYATSGPICIDVEDLSICVQYTTTETSGGRIVDEHEIYGLVEDVVIDEYTITFTIDDHYVDIRDVSDDEEVERLLVEVRNRI